MNSELLRKLCEITAVSGHEDRLIDFVCDYVKEGADDVHVDNLGNVTATYGGTEKDGGIKGKEGNPYK